MRRIEKEFTYPIWDEWRTDSFTKGITGKHTYKGPEFLTLEVNNDKSSPDYGKESDKSNGDKVWDNHQEMLSSTIWDGFNLRRVLAENGWKE